MTKLPVPEETVTEFRVADAADFRRDMDIDPAVSEHGRDEVQRHADFLKSTEIAPLICETGIGKLATDQEVGWLAAS